MEALGLDIADGILLAYAGAKREFHALRQGKAVSQKGKVGQVEVRSLTRGSKCRRKHVITDDELRTYKPGIFPVANVDDDRGGASILRHDDGTMRGARFFEVFGQFAAANNGIIRGDEHRRADGR